MGYFRGESTPVLFVVAGAGWAPVRQWTYRGSHESTFDKPHLSFGAEKRKVAPSNAGSCLCFLRSLTGSRACEMVETKQTTLKIRFFSPYILCWEAALVLERAVLTPIDKQCPCQNKRASSARALQSISRDPT